MANDDVIANRPPPMERPSRPKESERTTRKPLPWWDRVKLLLLFATVWIALVLGASVLVFGPVAPESTTDGPVQVANAGWGGV